MLVKKGIHRFLLSLTLLSTGIATSAAAETPYYATFGVDRHRTSISDSTFENYALSVHAGRWLAPGVALQVGAILPTDDDTVGSVQFSLDGLYTAGLRLEGPLENTFGTAAFVAAGFASANIAANSTFAQNDDWYHGYFATAGLLVGISKRSQLSFTYAYHAVDPAVSIPALQLGYRFQF